MAIAAILAGNALTAGATGFMAGAFSWTTFALVTASQIAERQLSPRQITGRIMDTSVQTTQEGSAIKDAYGVDSIAGTLIWSNGKTEHLDDAPGGKLGPPPIQNARYTTSFVSLLCHAPSGNRVRRPVKVYFNQHLGYDWNNGDEKGGTVSWDNTNKCWSFTSGLIKGKIRIYSGAQTIPDAFVAAATAAVYEESSVFTPAYVDRAILVAEEIELSEFGNDVPTIRVVLDMEIDTPRKAFENICSDAGLSSTQYDGSSLSVFDSDKDRWSGYVRTDVSPAKNYLEQMGSYLWCEFPTIDGKVTAKIKKGLVSGALPTADFVITPRDLRWASEGNASSVQVETERMPPREKAGRVEWTWMNPARRYNPSMRRAVRILGDALKVNSISIPVAQSSGWAKSCAVVELRRQDSEGELLKGFMSPEYYHASPTDLFLYKKNSSDEGQLFRLVQKQTPYFGPMQVGFVRHDAVVYSMGESEDTGSSSREEIVDFEFPQIMAADAPPLSDGKGKLGGVSLGDTLGSPGLWVAVSVHKRISYSGSFAHLVTGTQEINDDARTQSDYFPRGSLPAISGYLEEDWAVHGPDEINNTTPLFVRMFRGDLHSVTDAMLAKGANIMVFETGRYLQWKTATAVEVVTDEERWKIEGTLDGISGSDYEASAPSGVIPAGTRFAVVMDENATLGPGVMWMETDLVIDPTDGPYDATPQNIAHLDKLFVYAKKFPEEKARATRPLPFGYYAARNMEPNSPKLSNSVWSAADLSVDFLIRGRRYFRGGSDPVSPVTETAPYQLQIVICPDSIAKGSETASNSLYIPFTSANVDFAKTFSASQLASVPGYTGTETLRIRTRLMGERFPGRWGYIVTTPPAPPLMDENSVTMLDEDGHVIEEG